MDEIVWLHWEDLTQEEKKQARESYITIRELEEEIAHSTASKRVSDIAGKRFQRMPDGYIYVDVWAGPQKGVEYGHTKKGFRLFY